MNHSTRAPTRREAKRIEQMKPLGCVACAVLGIPFVKIEVHHILDGSKRMGHWFTIPLCEGHHQGRFTAEQRDLLEKNQQVSISGGRKLFNAVYGTERQLWERVQDRLKLPKVWPVSKILPRRGYAQVDPNTTAPAADVVGQPMGLAVQVASHASAESGSSARDGQEAR